DNTAAANRSVLAGSAGDDQIVQADVTPLSYSGSNRFFGVIGRCVDSSSYYYFVLRSGNTIELKKILDDRPTTIDSDSFTVVAGTTYTLKLEIVGTSLKVYINGELKLEGTDTSLSTGQVGLLAFFTSVDFDNVVVTDAGEPSAIASLTLINAD